MHPRQPVPETLHRLIDAQSGAISRAQALGLGLSPDVFRRYALGWQRVAQGIYLAESSTWLGFANAAVLRGGDTAALGGAAACHLHGLIAREPEQIYVWSEWASRPVEFPPYRADYREGLRRSRGTPSRLGVEAALIDLTKEVDEHGVVEAAARALAQRRSTPARILAELQSHQRIRHRKVIEELCDPKNQGIESVLEWLFTKNVLRAHRLPEPIRQMRVGRERLDAYFADYGVIVELDGRGFHSAHYDVRRDNRHAISGAITLRYTWEHIMRNPCSVAREIAQALRARGWDGGVKPCKQCRAA